MYIDIRNQVMNEDKFLRVSAQLVINLIKHAATLAIGDDTLKVIVDTGLDFFGDEANEKFNDWLEKPKTIENINKAIENAETCFRSEESKAHPDLKDVIHRYRGLSMVNLPSFVEEIEAWPKAPENTDWEFIVYKIFQKDFGRQFSDQDLRIAAKQYVYCLRKHLAMLGDDKFAPKLVADGIAQNQRMLANLEEDLAQVSRTVQTNFNMLAIGAERQDVIRQFTTHYLGTPDGKIPPRPFGGRSTDFEKLNTWLFDQNQPRYGLLVAEAGMGKSSVLLHWLKALRIDNRFRDWELVYYPISARFQTNLESQTLSTLAAQLGGLHNESVGAAKEGMDYRGQIYKYLNEVPLPTGKRLLVVVDGLDESASPGLPELLFPFPPPDKVNILVAARTTSDDRKWQERLWWKEEWIQPFSLGGLTKEGIADVLFRMGDPLAQLGAEAEIIDELFRLSEEGDPFLVELYIAELLKDQEKLVGLKVGDLEDLNPGLEGFFEKWIEDQTKIWGGDDPFEKVHVQAFKNLCAFAKGPLRIYDLLQIAPQNFNNQARLVRQAAETFERFIIGDGIEQGYVYTHPRLAQHFAKEEAHQTQFIQNQFAAYGENTLRGLNDQEIDPLNASREYAYIVQHYSDHLDEVNAPTEKYHSLISQAWLSAWEALEGTTKGFLGDVDKAWANAREQGSGGLSIQVLAGLCHASIISRSTSIGGELLMALWQRGYVTNTQLQNRIDQISNKRLKAETIIACWDAIKTFPEDVSENYHLELKWYIHQYIPVRQRGEYYLEFSTFLTKEEQKEYLLDAFAAAQLINHEESRAKVLSALVPHLPEDQLGKALAAARQITVEWNRARVLSAMIPYLVQEQLGEALAAARQMDDEEIWAGVLSSLVPRLPEEELDEALAVSLSCCTADRR
jgi:hypothetical protein